jgi:hypothetical protein
VFFGAPDAEDEVEHKITEGDETTMFLDFKKLPPVIVPVVEPGVGGEFCFLFLFLAVNHHVLSDSLGAV